MQIAEAGVDDVQKALFAIEMIFQDQDFHAEWPRCSMLANYIAAYVAYQFPQYGRAENLISTAVNELLESITYLSPGQSHLSLNCLQFSDLIRLDAKFPIREDVAFSYTQFMQKLSTSESQYLKLLTHEVKSNENFNQLGLAMLVHDFNIKFNTTLDEEGSSIQTQVFIPTKEFQT